mmetsp:Transcript_33795/g.73078  ORF Transcript_33795/g.73078 Transcript_33795/m.73078 type:complete len:1111 (-) Transcript_33795:161-3493(-)
MGRFKKNKGGNGYDTDASDSMSEISIDSSKNSVLSASSFRLKFGRKKAKKKSSSSSTSSSSSSRAATNAQRSTTTAADRDIKPKDRRPHTKTIGPGVVMATPALDSNKLMKDAKSRYNIGLVYLKTGDYAKAQENFEYSLYCHMQLSGHDSNTYGNDTIYTIAGVREKLGDCYVANEAVVDKFLASDHYEESCRLLKCVDPEDAHKNLTEMLERVEEKIKLLELRNTVPRNRRKPPTVIASSVRGIDRQTKVAFGDHPATVDVRGQTTSKSRKKKSSKKFRSNLLHNPLANGVGLISDFAQDFAHEVVDGIKVVVDVFDDSSDDEASGLSLEDEDWFETVMAHLERDNHRTAFKSLLSLKEEQRLMATVESRRKLAESLLKVADCSLEANKIKVANDAYEEAHAILKKDKHSGDIMKLALKGCIKSNKLRAKEMEGAQDYDSAISHRTKVYQFLDENNRTVPACQQQVKIAYLHAENDDYAKSVEALHAAIRRLHKGAKSVAYMASNRVKLLIVCHEMQAICYVKSKKWNDAVDQYDEVLPLILKKEGQGGKRYNSVLIRKSALLVMTGNYVMATPTINKYMKNAEHSNPDLIVDDLDHALALDTNAATHLKLKKVDKAIPVFEMKLAFVKTLPNNHQMKSDTMHKLGCLLANDNQLESALPLLDEALRTKKYVYDGNHKSVLETTWAVAATNHMLGNNDKALEHYSILLDNMANIEDMPVDAAVIQHSAGKLFFETGKAMKAVDTFRRALQGAKTSDNPQLESEITLNLANALSGQEKMDEAMELYDQLLNTKSLKKTKISFTTRFNKCLLLIKMGEVDEAKEMLHKMEENPSSMANHVRGSIFLTLGNLALLNDSIDEPMECFDLALDENADGDVSTLVYTKKSIAMAQLDVGEPDKAILTLEDVLEDISYSDADGKSVNLLKAEIWNSLARVYRKRGDLQQAIDFARLALQTYKTDLGEKNPITLRNLTNLQLLLLEEAEELVDYDDAKSISDAATYELEDALDAFESLDDPWTYRIDMATLKTNMGFVAVWQGKPKKARKLVCQIEEIELPLEHFLIHRIGVLGEHLEELEKTGGIKYDDVEKPQKRSNRKSKGRRQQSQKKSKRR